MMRRAVGDTLNQALFDLSERPLGNEKISIRAAEQAIDDGINDQRRNLQAKLAFELVGFEKIEYGGIGKRVDEFGIGELFAVGDGDLDDGAEIARERGAEVSTEAFVQSLQSAHLILADALG